MFRSYGLTVLSDFQVAERYPHGLFAEVGDAFLVLHRFVQCVDGFVRLVGEEVRLRLRPAQRLILGVPGRIFLKMPDVIVLRHVAGAVVLAPEAEISDVVLFEIGGVVGELGQYILLFVVRLYLVN